MAASSSMTIRPAGHFNAPRESRYCEPYVLVTRIHLAPSHSEVGVYLYGPWGRGSTRATADVIPLVWRESFWEMDVRTAPMAKPDDVIHLVALMEHLNGVPSAARVLVKKTIIEELAASAGTTQETRMARLIDKTNRAVDSANGGPNVTSAIGFRLQTEDKEALDTNGSRAFPLSFSGYGGHYCLRLKLSKPESVSRNDEAFARAAE